MSAITPMKVMTTPRRNETAGDVLIISCKMLMTIGDNFRAAKMPITKDNESKMVFINPRVYPR